jgi:hypothetical protein
VLVVWQEWGLGAEQAADIRRMMDAGIEIRVVADARWQMQAAVGGGVEMRVDGRCLGAVRQQAEQGAPEQDAFLRRARQQRVQLRLLHQGGEGVQAVLGGTEAGQVQDLVADRNAGPGPAGGGREDAEGQVLHREVRVRAGAGDPACCCRIVGLVDQVHVAATCGSSVFA